VIAVRTIFAAACKWRGRKNEETKCSNNLDGFEDHPDVLRDSCKLKMLATEPVPSVGFNHGRAFLVDQLVAFVNTELAASIEGANLIDAETPILELGILDSLAMVSLLAFIQTRFGVHVPDEAVIPENFENLGCLASLIGSHQLEQGMAHAARQMDGAFYEALRILERAGIERQWTTLKTGEEMHVLRVSGRGPTWVLLPGLGNPSSSWGAILRSLAKQQEALAIDFAGFGLSHGPQTEPTYGDHCRVIRALLEEIAAPPWILVGSSAGAMVAAELARQRPECVRALVITGFGLIADVDRWWQRLVTLTRAPEEFLAAAYYRPPKLTETLRRLMNDVITRPAYHSFLAGGGHAAMLTAFDGLSVPTLFVAGERDQIIPAAAVQAAARRVPGARLEWLARCGHFPPVEQSEELLYVIRSFLAQHRIQSGE
jgi:2-hydroxymuconate-semialdehyde hydrolase